MTGGAVCGAGLVAVVAAFLGPGVGRSQSWDGRRPGAVERVVRIAADEAAAATAAADSARQAGAAAAADSTRQAGATASAADSARHAAASAGATAGGATRVRPPNLESRTMGGAIGGVAGLVVGIAAQRGVEGGEPVMGMDYYAAPIVTTAAGVILGVAIGWLVGGR